MERLRICARIRELAQNPEAVELYLKGRYYWIGGNDQEALSEANRAFELDPLSPINAVTPGDGPQYGTTIRRRHCSLQEVGD